MQMQDVSAAWPAIWWRMPLQVLRRSGIFSAVQPKHSSTKTRGSGIVNAASGQGIPVSMLTPAPNNDRGRQPEPVEEALSVAAETQDFASEARRDDSAEPVQ